MFTAWRESIWIPLCKNSQIGYTVVTTERFLLSFSKDMKLLCAASIWTFFVAKTVQARLQSWMAWESLWGRQRVEVVKQLGNISRTIAHLADARLHYGIQERMQSCLRDMAAKFQSGGRWRELVLGAKLLLGQLWMRKAMRYTLSILSAIPPSWNFVKLLYAESTPFTKPIQGKCKKSLTLFQ